MRSILRPLATVLVVALAIGVAGVAAANPGDVLRIGVKTNDAGAADTKLSSSAPHFGLWLNETGRGSALRATATGSGPAARFDGPVQVNGACTGCLGRPGFALKPAGTQVTTLDSGNDVGRYVSATIGVDGLGLISYEDATTRRLMVAHCVNTACTSATTTAVLGLFNGTAGFWTSIAIGRDGLGLISSTQRNTKTGVTGLEVTHCSNVDCTAATSTSLASSVGAGTSIAIGSDGLGLISFQKGDGLLAGALAMAHCSNPDCTSATVTIENPPQLGGVPTWSSSDRVGADSSLTVQGDGLGLVTFTDTTDNRVFVTDCANPACTFLDLGQLVSSGTASSLVTGDDGRGEIAVLSGSEVRLFHCNDTEFCTNFDTSSQFESSESGVSITVGPAGQPILAGSNAGGPTEVADCADPACGEKGETPDTDESGIHRVAGTGSGFVSVTIGTDGFPLVATYDDAGHSLVVSHCSNQMCLPYFRRR
ncbi:MAG TPA: hypothetical protein VID47_04205 [Actinomycetota bacterium]|jgi:hypothetical protein